MRNDLYSFATRDLSATLVETTGEIPKIRVGHASALVSSVLIVWGGDTKQRETDKQDEGLYLLNLGTREWTRVATRGPAPAGRYGHSVAMIGSKFYVFGGQVDGEFLNDLWSFDLNTLKSSPAWELVGSIAGNEPPPKRTGHVMLSMDDTLYIFGGTDGSYHYNDTWAFDTTTRTWSELTCIGYIPVPREGHAAALVDDVMYVFGGRGVDGKDLNDLAAFKITNKRWFMFQNMGPSPSGRSGHAMATAGSRVFVLGGESFTSPKADDPMLIHVLDTKHIKYPDPKGGTPRRPQQGPGQPQNGSSRIGAMSPPLGSDTDDSKQEIGRVRSPPNGGMQPFPNQTQMTMPSASGKRPPTRPPRDQQGAADLAVVRGGLSDAEDPRATDVRSKSPTNVMGGPRVMSPPNGQPAMGYNAPNANRALRSPSPPPADAFVYPNNKGPNGQSQTGRVSPMMGHNRPGSQSNIAADVMREMRAKEAELETLRRRETWMRAALSKASKAGFSWNDLPFDGDGEGDNVRQEAGSEDARRLVDLAFRLKQERAVLQNTLLEQGRMATERIGEVERTRAAAYQEAAFSRAKLAAYESGKPNDAAKLENDRSAELEKQVTRTLADRASLEKKVAELNESLASEARLREQAEERMADLTQRALQAEGALERTATEHGALLEQHATTAAELRSTAEKLMSLTSSQQSRDLDNPSTNAELMELRTSRDRHLRALEQTQLALKAASARADEVEEQWRRGNEQIQHLQAEYADLGRELEAKIAEVDSARAQLLDVENKFAKSREEADALRALTTGSLGELLDYHRDMQADEERVGRAQSEKVRALQTEMEALREMLKGANQRYEEAQSELVRERKRGRAIESDQVGLRSQMSGLRSQLSVALADVARARKDLADKETELRESSKSAMDTDLRYKMFRNYLSESGVVVDEEDMVASTGGGSKLYEVEAKLAERNREQEQLNRQLRHAQEQSQAAEERVAALSAELARARERRSIDGDDSRIAEAERKLKEAEKVHSERLQVLEQDYSTAVMCVKGTEKMLRKMKDELAKQKGLNASLQSELDGVRSGSEGGSRVRPMNGRVTPISDDGQEAALRTQLVEAQRQTQRLTAENHDLHRRLDLLQGDLDRVRRELDNLQHEAENRLSRIEMLEDENERLESAVRQGGRDTNTDQLHRENASLRREVEQLSQRIALLLEVDDPSSNQRVSDSSMDPNINMESISSQMDDWQRQYGTGNSRPISDYDQRRA